MKGRDVAGLSGGQGFGSYHAPVSSLLGLSAIYFMLFLAHSLWRATLHTNAVKNFGLDGSAVGYLFSLTYLPGVFCFLIGLVATRLQLYRMVGVSCTLLSGGLIFASFASGFYGIATATLLVALGFTVFYTTANAICLISGQDNTVAAALGKMKSLGPLSGLVAAIIIIYVFAPGLVMEAVAQMSRKDLVDGLGSAVGLFALKPRLEPATLNNLLACVAVALLLFGLLFGRVLRFRAEGSSYGRLRIRRALVTYYVLNLLAGCRSAIFQAFALFVMIKEFHLPIHATAALVLAGNLCGFLGYRGVGYALGLFQHRHVLIFMYFVVACNFLGFWFVLGWSGFSEQATMLALCALFLVDSLFFGVSVVTDSHLRTGGDPASYVGDIGAGMTFFSVAAVLMSLLGGLLWIPLQHNAFLLGAGVCLVAMVVGRAMPLKPAATSAM